MAITFLDEEKEQPKGGITFLDEAGQSGVSMLDESRPLTGSEINQFLADDPGYARRMSLKDYEEYRRYKADNPVTVDAIGQALTKVGQDLSGAASAVAKNITSPGAIISALGRGAVVGTADLGDIIDRIVTFDKAPDTYNLYRAKKNLPDNEDTRKKYDELLAKDFATFQESQDYQAARAGVVQGSDIPEVTEASTYFLDPTIIAPGAQAAKIGTIADKAIGAAVRTAGKTARMVTRPAVEAVEGIAKTAAEVAGPAAKGAAAATGVTGAIMGVPGVRETVGAYAGLKTVDKAAEVAERVGESLMGQPSRIGALEAMGSVPNATAIDRAIGVVGRRGGDAAIDVLNAAAGGAVAGAAIGGALGFAAEGEEGLYGGIGSGLALGSLGAGLGRTVERVKGSAVAEARAADLARFTEALDEPTRDLFKRVIDRDGPDQAVMVMDGAALLRSQFGDAKVTFLPDTEFKERFGGSARGVQLETAGRPEIVINVDKPVSAYTFGHELFHAFDSVEQLKPQAEAIKQEIVGTFVQQPDGTFSQVKAGLLSPSEVDVAFKQYQRKLAQSGVATREWFSAKNQVEKAKLVGKELASEYMARMVTGGDVDGLLRGYDDITRTLLDKALINQGEGVIRGIAERLGLGSAPVESMLFKNLKEASPTLNAMLRDVIRARRNLSERMVLSEDSGVVIRQQDIGKPVVAEKALKMGVAERRPDGTVVMKDDAVLAREEDAETQAIRSAIEATPVADPTKPHLRVVDGEIRGAGISPEQVAAISSSPGVTNKLKAVLGSVSESLAAHSIPDAPNGLWVEYGAATRRVKSRLTGKYTSKYSSGIRLSQREVAPYELYISKAGNPVAKVVDVSKLRTTATDLASAGRLGPYERDIAGFLSDSVRYFDNISDPSGVRTRELPGMTDAKATFLNQYFGSQEKGGARFIRDLRLDRITEIRPTGERFAASELAWQRHKVDWMPEEKLPEGSVTSSKQGYRIISRNGKHSLYGADGQRIGIFDNKQTAEVRGQRDAREVFGPKEEDPARVVPTPDTDAGTVPGTPAPDAPVIDLPTEGTPFRWDEPANGAQFMPEVDESAFKTFGPDVMQRLLNDTDTVAVIHIDRMRVGEHNGVPLQGGMFYPAIKENLAKRVLWAFNSENVARTVANRAAQNGGYVKLALMQEGNVIGNKTFTHAWFKELRDNVAAGKITEKKALREMNEIRKRYKADKEMPTGHNRDWKSLDEAQQAFLDMPQTKRGRTYFQKTIRVTKADGEKIAYGALLAQQMTEAGFPDAIRLVDALEDKRFKGVPSGATVAILRFDPVDAKAKIGTAADYGVPEHLSYGYVLTGDIVAKMPYYNVVDQVRPELKNRLLSQAHTDFPVREIVPQSAEVAAGSINFMPDRPASPAETVLAELKKSQFIPSKVAIATLGAFPEYLKPVAQFIADQRQKLVNGSVSNRDLMKAYMVTIASQGSGAVKVKTLADKLAKIGVTFDPPQMFRTEKGDMIRPEEAAAYWLGTPEGQRALNNAEAGRINPEDWKGLVEVRKAYGDDRFGTFRVFSEDNIAAIPAVLAKVNASKGDSRKVIDAVQELKGISTGKKGFISHLLGIGDVPTIDAVELNFWLTGKGDIGNLNTEKANLARKVKETFSDRRVGAELFRRIDERIAQLRSQVAGVADISPDVWAHVMHHWLWDRAKGIETTHAGLYEAQRNFMPDTPEFRQWFGNSKAVNADGTPLVVYRGEHGEGEKGSVQSREASISFGSKSAAQEYSRSPNNRSDVAKNPRVIAANLKIERPFLNAPEDPFVEMSAIQSALGKDEAVKIAKRFSDVIERTDNWQNNFAEKYASVADLLSKRPDAINDLYLQAYPVLADHDVVKKLKAAGFDGAIHGGSGQTAGAPEYKVFDRSQINIVGDDRETRFMPDGLARISDNLERAGIKNDVSENGGLIRIHRMVVPADKRNQGLGSGAMQQLVNYADQTGKRIALSPSTDFGGSSVSRLKDFYRRFGFVDNKGRDQDLAVSETMIREPKPQVNFMPEAMPNGTIYRSNIGFTVVNKNGGKFRVYSPVGTLIAVANSLEEAQRMIERKAK